LEELRFWTHQNPPLGEDMDKEPVKAIVMISGGLDSALAVKVLLEQGIRVEAVNSATVFSKRTEPGRESAAKSMADQLGVELHTIDISEEQFEIVKSPKFGRGSSMNPCIDCHILMARKAKELMEKVGADFVATGEVLGQRPMSQHRQALRLVETESGLEGLLLRPLSAKLLEPTVPEREGMVDTSRLLAIRGRSRKAQMELAAAFGITGYETPAGGCILTDKSFGRRLRDLLDHDPDAGLDEVELLKHGRHLRLDGGVKVIVARNEEECHLLESHRANMDMFAAKDVAGPTVLATPGINVEAARIVAGITAHYGKGRDQDSVKVIWDNGRTETALEVNPLEADAISRWLIV
jgi:tRNA-specific 2-thiouridylase